jgi:AraC-like DNA-binding protein
VVLLTINHLGPVSFIPNLHRLTNENNYKKIHRKRRAERSQHAPRPLRVELNSHVHHTWSPPIPITWTISRLRMSSPIDLKTLTIERGYSCTHFLKMFREATGHSPHQYLLRLRVKGPQELMNNRSIPLMDIAPECGFASHSHLSDVFRQIVRAPPGDFRRETSGHFRASLVVSGKRALEIWIIAVCVNGIIVDHWRGKSGNSDSLVDEELERSPNRSKGALFSLQFLRCWPTLFYIERDC